MKYNVIDLETVKKSVNLDIRYYYGLRYLFGIGVEADLDTALELLSFNCENDTAWYGVENLLDDYEWNYRDSLFDPCNIDYRVWKTEPTVYGMDGDEINFEVSDNDEIDYNDYDDEYMCFNEGLLAGELFESDFYVSPKNIVISAYYKNLMCKVGCKAVEKEIKEKFPKAINKHFHAVNAFAAMETVADKDNLEAMYFLGLYYQWGLGTEKNDLEALKCFHTVASGGSLEENDDWNCKFTCQALGYCEEEKSAVDNEVDFVDNVYFFSDEEDVESEVNFENDCDDDVQDCGVSVLDDEDDVIEEKHETISSQEDEIQKVKNNVDVIAAAMYKIAEWHLKQNTSKDLEIAKDLAKKAKAFGNARGFALWDLLCCDHEKGSGLMPVMPMTPYEMDENIIKKYLDASPKFDLNDIPDFELDLARGIAARKKDLITYCLPESSNSVIPDEIKIVVKRNCIFCGYDRDRSSSSKRKYLSNEKYLQEREIANNFLEIVKQYCSDYNILSLVRFSNEVSGNLVALKSDDQGDINNYQKNHYKLMQANRSTILGSIVKKYHYKYISALSESEDEDFYYDIKKLKDLQNRKKYATETYDDSGKPDWELDRVDITESYQYEPENDGLGKDPQCTSCCFVSCPYKVAAYLQFLKNYKDPENKILNQRELSHYSIIDSLKLKYDFQIDDKELSRIYALDTKADFSFAKKLAEDGMVYWSVSGKEICYHFLINERNIDGIKCEKDFTDKLCLEPQINTKEKFDELAGGYAKRILKAAALWSYILVKNKNIYELRKLYFADKFLQEITSKDARYFYGVIESDDINLRNSLCEKIHDDLESEWTYQEIRFFDFCEKIEGIKESSSSYYSDDIGDEIDKSGDKILYVITDLDYKPSTKDYNKIFQYKETMEYLENILLQKYIILNDNKENVAQFLSYGEKLKYIFSLNKVNVDRTYDWEELYDRFKAGISKDLKDRVEKDDKKYRNDFRNFINEKSGSLPYVNQELALYLVDYCNKHNTLELPALAATTSWNSVIGMEEVKKQFENFRDLIEFAKDAQIKGIKIARGNMHMMFTGNPGTGKTMVARIMAKELFQIGIVKKNIFVEVERKDLVGMHQGHTAAKTAEVIQRAMGGVLFIDEAYALVESENDNFGHECVATLIKAMEDHKDDLVVIFAGYDEEMHKFISSNTGIKSRIGYEYHFPNYNADELGEIFESKIKEYGFSLEESAIAEVKKLCEENLRTPDFGNGRFVDKIIQRTLQQHAHNYKEGGVVLDVVSSDDIPKSKELEVKVENNSNKISDLKNIIGLESVKNELNNYINRKKFMKSTGMELKRGNNSAMVFQGNPGTGKSMIAESFAKELYDNGFILANKLVDVKGSDLLAEHIGQSGPKVLAKVKQAVNGVLFIDDAYTLDLGVANSSSEEAKAMLVKCMNDYSENLLFVFAGPEDRIQKFLNNNLEIRCRIGKTINFENYSAQDISDICREKLEDNGFFIDDKVEEENHVLTHLNSIVEEFLSYDNFDNGRFAEKICDLIIEKHIDEYFKKKEKTKSDEASNSAEEDLAHNGEEQQETIDNPKRINVEDLDGLEDKLKKIYIKNRG